MSLVGVIARLSTAVADGGYTVTRTANGGYDPDTGDATDGAVTTFPLDAVIHTTDQLNGRGVVAGQEGRHTEDVILIMTSVELFTVSSSFQADKVTYRGDTYEVVRVDGPFTLRGASHFEVYAARMVNP